MSSSLGNRLATLTLQSKATLARRNARGCTAHHTLAASIVLLVTEQLNHVPARLQDYCRRDTFSSGYAMGAIFYSLRKVDTSVSRVRGAEICIVVFEQLYGDDGPTLLDKALRQMETADYRFMAGAQAGACDLADWLGQRVPQYRLAKEFSLYETLT